ncbi:hypothetical protein H6783_02235 [Candidatus Nomurabacteria bacterium]|nr:hypothetical protein [Candidatus Nomurabacteria bacterium]
MIVLVDFANLTASTGLTLTGTNLTVRSASESQTGIAEFATQTEVNTGTDTTRVVRANTLGAWPGTTNLTTLGTITTGTWNGTAIGDAYLTKTGDWTGTFDGQEGSYYLDLANATGDTDDLTEGSTNLFSDGPPLALIFAVEVLELVLTSPFSTTTKTLTVDAGGVHLAICRP